MCKRIKWRKTWAIERLSIEVHMVSVRIFRAQLCLLFRYTLFLIAIPKRTFCTYLICYFFFFFIITRSWRKKNQFKWNPNQIESKRNRNEWIEQTDICGSIQIGFQCVAYRWQAATTTISATALHFQETLGETETRANAGTHMIQFAFGCHSNGPRKRRTERKES